MEQKTDSEPENVDAQRSAVSSTEGLDVLRRLAGDIAFTVCENFGRYGYIPDGKQEKETARIILCGLKGNRLRSFPRRWAEMGGSINEIK